MTRLAFLMTAGQSLNKWYLNGNYDREIKLYHTISEYGIQVAIFDYSTRFELEEVSEFIKRDITKHSIKVIPLYGDYCGNSRLRKLLASIHTVIISKERFSHIKTNQSKGSWLAIILKLKNKNVKFLHRSGYCWSDFTWRLTGSRFKFFITRFLELIANLFADEIHVASELDKKNMFEFEKRKTLVVPNWVNVQKVTKTKTKNISILIGRFEKQKGIIELLNLWPEDENLILVGTGSLCNQIEMIIKKRKLLVKIKSPTKHSELMKLLSSCKCLINWSDFEGNPKVILEALFCGIPVIAKDVPGVNEILRKGAFGGLVKDKHQLFSALKRVVTMEIDEEEVDKKFFSSKYAYSVEKNIQFLK